MNIKFTKQMWEAVGVAALEPYGLDAEQTKWTTTSVTKSLDQMKHDKVRRLIALLEPHSHVKGVRSLLIDCTTWLRIAEGGARRVRARKTRHAEALLYSLLHDVPGHRVYRRDDDCGIHHAYYVGRIAYHPAEQHRDYTTPEHVTMELHYQELGECHCEVERWECADCRGRTAEEMLALKGLVMEMAELRADYLARKEHYDAWFDKVGMQFLATGSGSDDLDGNDKKDDSRYWWRSRSNVIPLERDGERSRVVVDVLQEQEQGDQNDRRRQRSINPYFWDKRLRDADEDEIADTASESEEAPESEIPIHLTIACFDLKRHLRLKIDVGQLTLYIYNPQMGEKLILPSDSRALVTMLVSHHGGFQDIVNGKSGGSIILCAGIPGTGKTLTAEVYAEVMSRPLYSVQASQLGTDPDALEDNLLKVFARAKRWNAVLLLDEADVYVASRGHDLTQNAIVGVFLRVLEYYSGVLFLTTNRADLVDDAIASRCVARIDYAAPDIEDQRSIWRVLSATSGIVVSDAVIARVSERFPTLTGRDVKNLLKLAGLVSKSRNCPITEDVLRFAKRFKPTVSGETQSDDTAVLDLPPELQRPPRRTRG